jgi:ABC-type multidrug transport system fused ATPase/permease subunit
VQIIYGKEDATDEEVWDAVKVSALDGLVRSLPEGLDTLVGERGMKLSGGEKDIDHVLTSYLHMIL